MTRRTRRWNPEWLSRRLQGLRKLLKRPVSVKREGLQVQVVLGPEQNPAATTRTPASARAEEAAHMRKALSSLLDQHPAARSVFASLVIVERSLRSRSGAFDRLPDQVVSDAVAQLDRLVGDPVPQELSGLRGRLESMLRQRQAETARLAPEGGSDSQIEVCEGSLSVFMEADQEWSRQMKLSDRQRAVQARGRR
jgi:hypothetical protein